MLIALLWFDIHCIRFPLTSFDISKLFKLLTMNEVNETCKKVQKFRPKKGLKMPKTSYREW